MEKIACSGAMCALRRGAIHVGPLRIGAGKVVRIQRVFASDWHEQGKGDACALPDLHMPLQSMN